MNSRSTAIAALLLVGAIAWIAWPSPREASPTSTALEIEAGDESTAPAIPREQLARTEQAVVPADVPTSQTELVPNLGLLLHGRVTSPLGAGIWKDLRGQLTFVNARGERIVESLDDRGVFALFDLEPGRYDVEVRAWRHRTLETRFELLPEPTRQRLELELEVVPTIPVFLVDEHGTPRSASEAFGSSSVIQELAVAVSSDAFPSVLPPLAYHGYRTSAGGIFRTEPAPQGGLGWLEVHGTFPLHAALLRRNAVVAQQLLDSAPERLDFVVDAARVAATQCALRARIAAKAAAEPSTKVRWELGQMQGARSGAPLAIGAELRLTALSPGSAFLELEAPGFARLRRCFVLEPGKELDLGTLELAPAVIASGRVVDEAGTLRNARLRIFELDRDLHQEFPSGREERSSGAGFELQGLAAGRYAVSVEIAGHATKSFELDLRGVAQRDLVWQVERGRPLELEIGEADHVAWSFVLFDTSGLPLVFWQQGGVPVRQLHLAPGAYRVEYRSGSTPPRSFDVRVWDGANEPVRVP